MASVEEKLNCAEAFTKCRNSFNRTANCVENVRIALNQMKDVRTNENIQRLSFIQKEIEELAREVGRMIP